LGQGRFLSGNEDEAKELMVKAAEQLPNDPVLMLNLGKVFLQSDPVAAERWLRQCLTIDPSDTEAQYTLVNALQRQRRRDEAEKMFAEYQVAKARLDRANKLLQEEARNPSQGPERLAEIGRHLLEVGQERQGVFWLNKALAFDPKHVLANRLLAEHYDKKGEAESAAVYRRRLRPTAAAP
jgi:predicted Zn-dependent protease